MTRFRKKPVVVDAYLFDGSYESTAPFRDASRCRWYSDPKPHLAIPTLEGVMIAQIDDWVIKGVNGEFYPIKPDIMVKTYEPVEVTTLAENSEPLHPYLDAVGTAGCKATVQVHR